jgi:RND family efflux transporter MFP subunit
MESERNEAAGSSERRPGWALPRAAAAASFCLAAALAWPFMFSSRSTAEPAAAPATEIAAHQPASRAPIETLDPALAELREEGDRAARAEAELLDCMIQPSKLVDLGSPVVGLIEEIRVRRSDVVKRDQVLVQLESGAERAAVELARARSEMDGAEQARAAKERLGSHKEARARRLFDQKALSLDLREESETAAELARFELEQAREERRLAALQLAQAEELLRRRTIKSPVDGVVVDRLMEPGERVDEEVVLRIAQIDPLLVEVTLPAAMFGKVKPGMRASIEPELGGEHVYVASVATVDRVIDAASGTFDMHLELPNPDHAVPSGMHCRARLLEP